MGLFSRSVSQDDVTSAIKSAVTDATLGATLAAHMAQCEKDKAEQQAVQLRMHEENKRDHETRKHEVDMTLSELKRQNVWIMRFIWMAMGAATLLSFGAPKFLVGHL